jgi:NTP pyrophosphatase (non-canonical NTP hydrolase)
MEVSQVKDRYQAYNRELSIQAAEKWGVDSQLDVVIEELSELTQEICKYRRGRITFPELAGELADVEVMVEFMRWFVGDVLVDEFKFGKLERLRRRIANDKLTHPEATL